MSPPCLGWCLWLLAAAACSRQAAGWPWDDCPADRRPGTPTEERSGMHPRRVLANWVLGLEGVGPEEKDDARRILNGPGDEVLQVLVDLALRRMQEADGVNPEVQIFWLLMAIEFGEVQGMGIGSHIMMREVVKDLDLIRMLPQRTNKYLSSSRLVKRFGSARSGYALDEFAKYYLGRKTEASRKTALIFTCSFGSGHKSAANAVKQYLAAEGLQAEVLDTTMDPEMTSLTEQAAQEMFNDFVLKLQMYHIHNWQDAFSRYFGVTINSPCPVPKCNSPRKHKFRAAVLRRRPSLLVTVYHMDLISTLEVAKELGNLAVVHLATDMDIKMQEIFIHTAAHPVYPRFRVGVPFDMARSLETAKPVPLESVFLSGYPVRQEFLRPFDERAADEERLRLAPVGTRIVLVMTGGGGQDVLAPYWLAEDGLADGRRMHVVVVAGGNKKLEQRYQEKFEETRSPPGRLIFQGNVKSVTLEVARDPENTRKDRPFFLGAARISLLMDAADVVLSKPGGGSTAEVAYRGTPALFDTSRTLLHWEHFTVNEFVRHGRGVTFTGKASLQDALLKAFALGRSRKLVQARNGQFLDPRARVVAACIHMLSLSPQPGWRLFDNASA